MFRLTGRGTLGAGLAMVLSITQGGTPAVQAAPPPEQQVVERAKPAVVMIRSVWTANIATRERGIIGRNIEYPGHGTGFTVHEDGWIITNGHVVQGTGDVRNALCVRFVARYYQSEQQRGADAKELQRIEDDFARVQQSGCASIKAFVVDNEGRVLKEEEIPNKVSVRTYRGVPGAREAFRDHPAEVRGRISPAHEKDIAILKIERKNMPTVKLGDSETLKVAEKIQVIGYPGVVTNIHEAGAFSADTYLEPSTKDGSISALRKWFDQSAIYEFSAAIAPGNSGGPVINQAGEVVGVASLGAPTRQGFNFMRPVNTVKEFLRGHVDPRQGETDRVFSEALGLFWSAQDLAAADKARDALDRFTRAREKFIAVTELYREHPTAERFQAEAQKAIQHLSNVVAKSWPPWLLYGGAGLGGLAVIALGGAFLVRRRTNGVPRAPVVAVSGLHLIVKTGPQAGSRLPIGGDVRIGRDSQLCQVLVSDDTASREHAMIRLGPDGKASLIGLSKTNPTFVNERSVTETPLHDNDLIRVGASTFIFKTGER